MASASQQPNTPTSEIILTDENRSIVNTFLQINSDSIIVPQTEAAFATLHEILTYSGISVGALVDSNDAESMHSLVNKLIAEHGATGDWLFNLASALTIGIAERTKLTIEENSLLSETARLKGQKASIKNDIKRKKDQLASVREKKSCYDVDRSARESNILIPPFTLGAGSSFNTSKLLPAGFAFGTVVPRISVQPPPVFISPSATETPLHRLKSQISDSASTGSKKSDGSVGVRGAQPTATGECSFIGSQISGEGSDSKRPQRGAGSKQSQGSGGSAGSKQSLPMSQKSGSENSTRTTRPRSQRVASSTAAAHVQQHGDPSDGDGGADPNTNPKPVKK